MQPAKIAAKAKLQVERARARYGAVDIAVQTFKTFSLADGGTQSAALTYYFFFSIFPLLLFAASILGYLTFGNDELRREILKAGVDSVPLIRDILSPAGLEFIEDRRNSIAVTASFLALYSGTGAVVALEHSLNVIQGVEQERKWIGKRVAALKWLAILGSAAVLSLGFGAVAGYAGDFFDPPQRVDGKTADVLLTGDLDDPATAVIKIGGERFELVEGEDFGPGYSLASVEGQCAVVEDGGRRVTLGPSSCRPLTTAGLLGSILGHLGGGLVGILLFATAFTVLPASSRGWREAIPGAVAAAIAFEVLKVVGAWYLQRGAAGREAAFGVFASAAGLLVASYLIAQIMLLAATLNDVLADRRMTRRPSGPDDKEDEDGRPTPQ